MWCLNLTWAEVRKEGSKEGKQEITFRPIKDKYFKVLLIEISSQYCLFLLLIRWGNGMKVCWNMLRGCAVCKLKCGSWQPDWGSVTSECVFGSHILLKISNCCLVELGYMKSLVICMVSISFFKSTSNRSQLILS